MRTSYDSYDSYDAPSEYPQINSEARVSELGSENRLGDNNRYLGLTVAKDLARD